MIITAVSHHPAIVGVLQLYYHHIGYVCMIVLGRNVTFGLAPAKKRVFPVSYKIHAFSVFLVVITHKTSLK